MLTRKKTRFFTSFFCLFSSLIVMIILYCISTLTSTTKESVRLLRPANKSVFYRQATSTRNSSFPFVSGDTFRGFSTFIFDETRQDSLVNVQHGDIIFLKGDMLAKFFSDAMKTIKNPFVLVTHNSDHSAPSSHGKFLSDEKLLHWFGSNPSTMNRTKFSPIPIGLANRRWSHGTLANFTYAFEHYRKSWAKRTNLLYVNFDVRTNQNQREKALAQAKKLPSNLVQIIPSRIPLNTYLEQVGNTKFVLSPPGNGLDCHRTWEALLMGAVPIVLTSPLDPLFINKSVVILDDWSKVTENFLLSLNFSSFDFQLIESMTADYWWRKISQYRQIN